MGHRVLPGMSGACPRAPFEARHCSPSRRERCQGNGRAWFVWHCRGWTLTVGLYLAQMSHWPADDQDGHRVLGPKVTGGSREGEERETLTWRKGKEMEKRDTQGERQDRRRVHVTQTHRHIRTHQARARSRAVPKAVSRLSRLIFSRPARVFFTPVPSSFRRTWRVWILRATRVSIASKMRPEGSRRHRPRWVGPLRHGRVRKGGGQRSIGGNWFGCLSTCGAVWRP